MSEAWRVRDAIVGGGRDSGPVVTPKELSGHLVAQWANTCAADLTFDNVQAALVSVAESTAPYLPPSVTAEMWGHGARVPVRAPHHCAATPMAPALRCHGARRGGNAASGIARRDATGRLRRRAGAPGPASEYAFLATVSALVCRRGGRPGTLAATQPYLSGTQLLRDAATRYEVFRS